MCFYSEMRTQYICLLNRNYNYMQYNYKQIFDAYGIATYCII